MGLASMERDEARECPRQNKTTACRGSFHGASTSNKTMKSLSASVYDELEPFRLAHRNLIKNRMATKTASVEHILRSARAVGCPSATRRRKKTPLESGLEKITMCASSFPWTFGKQCIKGFQRFLQMRPIEFKEQLQMSLHIYLRPSEAVAVASYFDVDDVGSVNGEFFARWLVYTGNNARQERLRKQAIEMHEEEELQKQRWKDEESWRRAADEAAVSVEFSPRDRAAAEEVLGKVAVYYHDQRTGREAAQRDFAGALRPVDFRDQLSRSFKIRLTNQQFSALFQNIEKNGDGTVDGSKFLIYFFGLINRERTKEFRQGRTNRHVQARNFRLHKLPTISPILGR